ncbi:MAG: MliC family protein [Methyloligella sp. ZOD6]
MRVLTITKRSHLLLAALLACVALPASVQADDAKPIAEAVFKCDGDKSIDATFYEEKVDLTLSDGRSMELPQVISGSGARYANADESFVFWNKGNTAFVTEGPDEKMTFENCVDEKDAD